MVGGREWRLLEERWLGLVKDRFCVALLDIAAENIKGFQH